MLWRVRVTLEDRPGALAALAVRCGADGVNILGLQVFPSLDGGTMLTRGEAPFAGAERARVDALVALVRGETPGETPREATDEALRLLTEAPGEAT